MPLLDNLTTPNEDLNLENDSSPSSPDQPQETEESIQDKTLTSPENSLATDGSGTDCRIFEHAAVEETVQRVVQQVKDLGKMRQQSLVFSKVQLFFNALLPGL